MRTINVSTSTYAALWSQRRPGEESEEAILRRLLQVSDDQPPEDFEGEITSGMPRGFVDQRNRVVFAEGTEIFRTYKGTEYRAVARGGRWLLLNTKRSYSSLHKLSSAVVEGNENSWLNWKTDLGGQVVLIDRIRNPT